MFLVKAFLCLAFLVANNEAANGHKTSDNSSSVSWHYGSGLLPENEHLKYGLTIFSPTKPGNYSVVVFLIGLDSNLPEFVYQTFGEQFAAETNRILIIFSKLRIVSSPESEEVEFEATLNWILENMDKLFTADSTPKVIKENVRADLTTNGLTLMGHSSGNHIITIYLEKTCGIVKKLILLDPVDGTDPFGLNKDYVIHPPNKVKFVIPTLFGISGLADVPAFSNFPPCAPDFLSNMRFYDAFTGPRWHLTFDGYGHADFLDNWVIKCCSSKACKSCDKGCDFDKYRLNLIKALGYFLQGVDAKNSILIDVLQAPMNSPGYFDNGIHIDSFFNSSNYNILKTGPFCDHQ